MAEHELKTQKGVDAWVENVNPPIKVQQHKCNGCGRMAFKAFKDGVEVGSQGF